VGVPPLAGARVTGLGLGLLMAVLAQDPARHLVVVTGLGGEPAYRNALTSWAVSLAGTARSHGIPEVNVHVLTGDSTRGYRRASRANILATLLALPAATRPGDEVFLFLAGHGSGEGPESRLNIPGPDITAADLAVALDALEGRRVVVINAASASGDMLKTLSGPGRVVITATRSPYERNATRFGGFFVEALAGPGADVNKDGRVSVLEAFLYARRETARFYQSDQRLLTEHAVLDDNGDGTGSAAPGADSTDGALARTFFLAPPAAVTSRNDSAAAELVERRRGLERQIEGLRGRKAAMRAEDYEAQLEELLVQLALTNEALRAREPRP